MNGELVRIVDAIHRDKAIDKELIFASIEQALSQAARKHLGLKDLPTVKIDRATGNVTAWDGETPIDPAILGRIAYQQARQIFVQKLREAESDTVFAEFAHKRGDIVTAFVARYEGPHLVCRIGDKAEATMLKSEQVPGESYRIGGRVRAYIADVEKKGTRIKIYLSRAHEDFVQRLFHLEVPEIADGTVLIKGIAREPGYRTKLTVTSTNDKVDCLGACVGVRGSRIRNVVDELNGENVDIVRWSEDPKELIKNALKPAEVAEVLLEPEKVRATVYVLKNELSQAIGKGGRNVRLASKLTGWEIDIYELGGETAEPAKPAAEAPPGDGGAASPVDPAKPEGEVSPSAVESDTTSLDRATGDKSPSAVESGTTSLDRVTGDKSASAVPSDTTTVDRPADDKPAEAASGDGADAAPAQPPPSAAVPPDTTQASPSAVKSDTTALDKATGDKPEGEQE